MKFSVHTTIDLRPRCPISRFPTPKHLEASTMPPKDRLRLNQLGCTEQVRPEPRHPYQQSAVNAVQSKTRRRPPQSNIELMTEKQILGFKPTPRLEHISDEHSECVQDRKHRIQ
jgi:hypothetical protein